MDDRSNTIAGWVLAGAVVALGGSIFSGLYFHGERPETMGYQIEGVEQESDSGAAAVEPIANRLAKADAAKGQAVFAKCQACHVADQGGGDKIGPNLYGVVGRPHAAEAGFAYSDALKSVPGNWTFQALDDWLASPRKYAPGTKMTFAGLSDPMDRADVILFLNSKGSNLPLPAPEAAPAADAAAEGDNAAAANNAEGDAAAANAAVEAQEAQAPSPALQGNGTGTTTTPPSQQEGQGQ